MALTDDQFRAITLLIEDGELDDRMIDLQRSIDERNLRRQDDILKLVRSVWGANAQIVGGPDAAPTVIANAGTAPPPARSVRAPVEYRPDEGPAIPAGTGDSMGSWPSPVESQAGGGGGTGFSPVADPMSESGGSDPFGDNNPNVVSTGAQIG